MVSQAHPNSSQEERPFAFKNLGCLGISCDATWDDFASLGREVVMPGRPFQSKLEPHLDFIREGRRKRWSYKRIAQAIGEQFGLPVSSNAVFSFVKVRSKPLRMYELAPTQPLPLESKPSTSGFFEPAPTQKPHETRKPKFNINL
jgi:hypothetical protein